MPRHLLKIDDLGDNEIDGILSRAGDLQTYPAQMSDAWSGTSRLLGLVFLQTSLRTRLGFKAAAARMGWQSCSIFEQRSSPTSMPESAQDTVRVVAGMTDFLVCRAPVAAVDVARDLPVPLINGGDEGPTAEHPTQALIDLFAIMSTFGPVNSLHVAICGDLRSRATRSFRRLLERRPPATVTLISAPALCDLARPEDAHRILTFTSSEAQDLPWIDVLYVAGIPHQAIPENIRDTLRVTPAALSRLKPDGVILSPLPVIDEIDANARGDARCRMFTQSDNAVFVRAAVLEWIAAANKT